MLRECQNCGKEFKGTERAKFCSSKCRVQFNRDKDLVTQTQDSVTERVTQKYTKTDKEFQDHYSNIKDLGPDWLKFGDVVRNPTCGQCGKTFKTRLQMLRYCSLSCRSQALSLD